MAPVELERRDEVFLLRMTADDNRFNPDSLAAWHRALDEVEASEGAAALVTTGNGKFYSNGLDLDWMGAQDDSAAGAAMVSDVIKLFGRVVAFPMYTVAAINGHAFAAGAMMALAHDARVMRTDRGYFCLPEVDLGMPLAPGMTALIKARLSPTAANEAVVTGRRYSADDCLAAGIVDAVAPEAEVVRDAVARALQYAGKDRAAVAVLKQGLHAELLAVLAEGALN